MSVSRHDVLYLALSSGSNDFEEALELSLDLVKLTSESYMHITDNRLVSVSVGMQLASNLHVDDFTSAHSCRLDAIVYSTGNGKNKTLSGISKSSWVIMPALALAQAKVKSPRMSYLLSHNRRRYDSQERKTWDREVILIQMLTMVEHL